MFQLNHQAFFWKEFDDDGKPISAKECQVIFSPETGGKISFLADLNNEFDYEEHKNEIIPILYAQAIDGKKITLVNVKFGQAMFQLAAYLELTRLEYSIEYIFNGGWIDICQSIGVIHVRYSYLEFWFNQMEIRRPHDTKDKTFAGVIIHKEHLEGSSQDYKVLININNGFSAKSFNNKSITYEATNSLAMAKKGDFSLTGAIELAQIVKSFFEMVTFYSKNRIFIEEFYIIHTRKIRDGYEEDEIVHLLFKQDNYEDEKIMSHIEFLFRYEDIKENFVQILNNWIEIYNKNQNEYSAFCTVISDKQFKFNIYSHFFQLISALEAYHRLQNKKLEEQEEANHQKYLAELKSKLSSCLTSHEKKKIIHKIKYQYGPNFKDRLKELIEISQIKELVLCDDIVHDEVIGFIYKMRNEIAHLKNEIEVNQKLASSFEYLKLIALLIMFNNICIGYTKFSKRNFDIDLKHLENLLTEVFSKKRSKNISI